MEIDIRLTIGIISPFSIFNFFGFLIFSIVLRKDAKVAIGWPPQKNDSVHIVKGDSRPQPAF